MKYIVYFNDTLKVKRNGISDVAPASFSDTLSVARCDNIPPLQLGEYYEVYNIQEHLETYTEKEEREVKKVDEEGIEYPDTEYVDVEKTRPYKTCELRVKVNEKVVKRIRLRKLKAWFDNDYRYYTEKLTRFNALGIDEVVTDKTFNLTYTNLNELYTQAENVRTEINELEKLIGGKYEL
jgi:hypothetical protein